MSYPVGARVRFSAQFKRLAGDGVRVAFDPEVVTAMVTQAGYTRTYMQRSGIRRKALGEFFVEIVVENGDFIEVKFTSSANGEEGVQRAKYQVGFEAARVDFPDPVAAIAPPEPLPAYGVQISRRGEMADALRASGVRVDDSESDAFIEGAYSELLRERRRLQTLKTREAMSRPSR